MNGSNAAEFNCNHYNYNPKNIYPLCENLDELVSKSYEKSISENKQTILIFGYSACPWCQNLHKLFKTSKKEEFKKYCNEVTQFNVQEIPVGFYYKDTLNQNQFKSLRGKEIINEMAEELDIEIDGYPAIVVVNPKNNKKQFIDTGELEDNTNGEGHSYLLLCEALKKAYLENL